MRYTLPVPDNQDPTRCAACGRTLDVHVAEVIIPTRYGRGPTGRIEVTGHRLYLVCNDDGCIRSLVADTRDWHEVAIEDDLVTGGVSLSDYDVAAPKTA